MALQNTGTTPTWQPRVALLLAERERSWAWLARKVGMSRSYMSRLSNGDPRYHLTAHRCAAIADALNTPKSLIFDDKE